MSSHTYAMPGDPLPETRLGLALPQYGPLADPAAAARVATAAEELGYRSLWVGDRLLVATDPQSRYPGGDGTPPVQHQTFLDPLTVLTVAAGATREARLGTSTLNALWQPPVLLARTLATLDQVSGGRLDVGLGLGWSKDEYGATGVPWRGRGARLEETLDLLAHLWADGPEVGFKGEHWTVPDALVRLKPAQRPGPPVLLGGFSPDALARVARRADGWLGAGLPLPALRGLWQSVGRQAVAAGRDPAALRLVLRINPVVTRDPMPAEHVPHRGTVQQLAAYLAETITSLGAEPLIDLHLAARTAEEYLDLAGQFHELLSAG
ncbi:LLM class F420-dependent oxidoreductase [Kitasatospora sp. MMS16-BH015]|uniref:TIGR03619 family F420-dependent LLM class oxidoreductase n=1 Tax=Kitasatospora sp. MMS16-BH015 TaxID=2018025 RepID=UPI000CA224F0|nr:TIGR03619 family F420-dependent LLM class oxidoreductase [Kitasatospora sp. MMS16-BH015]AUG80562.1 LLM class F420-dependent oxidoreductase [Kitasatospora sp. MMS16-BH015]